jgi:hypothetical protein
MRFQKHRPILQFLTWSKFLNVVCIEPTWWLRNPAIFRTLENDSAEPNMPTLEMKRRDIIEPLIMKISLWLVKRKKRR